MHGEFGLFVGLVQPDGLVDLALRRDGAWVALLVNPLDGEGVASGEPADLSHLVLKLTEADRVGDVRHVDLPVCQNKQNTMNIYYFRLFLHILFKSQRTRKN